MNKVFVYGTLKRGHRLHDAMNGAKFLKEGLIQGILFDLGSFPAVIENPPKELFFRHCGHVKGELYEADSKIMQRLDQIEGHPHFYTRKPTIVDLGEKLLVDAWVYMLPYSHVKNMKVKLLTDGVWHGRA